MSLNRSDIAERLHSVMETQWQRALEIITSPEAVDACNSASGSGMRPIDVTKLDRDRADGVAGLYLSKAENEVFETPVSGRLRQPRDDSDADDKLQQYIDLVRICFLFLHWFGFVRKFFMIEAQLR